ncbi:TetR/AcrR family transcriptional regulator [Brachybacterium fresconis]|uniref:AcrR family transcriptional regulator n=1 Tax=Brachybacterium fresconis TaxID=173363 RepID=A0ABS4YI26_9MICO|nr:TetR family transcriptional regulator [Brachybacterium fresconis]MBP2408411.1 AcrR family transcriptional regulator [Brachybacterium fresconis]
MTTEEAGVGRREQNRRRTERALHEAALACAERDGYRGATVARIAEAAGVAPRTFFRYFATKDEVMVPGQQRVRRLVEEAELPEGDLAPAVRAIADLCERALGAAELIPELEELPRLERLVAGSPELQAAMTHHDAQIAEAVTTRLIALLPQANPLDVHLAGEVVMAMWRTSWDRWRAEALEVGPTALPLENFRACRARLAPVLDALTGR